MRRRWTTFGRIVNAGIVNFIRNVTLAVAAMAVMVVTLTIVLFSLITNASFEHEIKEITSRISVSVFIEDTTTKEQTDQLIEKLESQPEVEKIVYLDKAAALRAFVAQNRDNPNLEAAANQAGAPIPATIQVYPKNLNQVEKIKDFLVKPENLELQTKNSPSYKGERKEAIDNITHATNVLRKIGIITVSVFTLICALIIFNTIQMAIFNRRDEITIMRLLGASTSFIRGPFVVESAIYGFLSAVLSVLLINSAFLASSNALQASSLGLLNIDYASQYFDAHFFQLLGLQIALGIIIGTVSSVIATRRYLKFKTK